MHIGRGRGVESDDRAGKGVTGNLEQARLDRRHGDHRREERATGREGGRCGSRGGESADQDAHFGVAREPFAQGRAAHGRGRAEKHAGAVIISVEVRLARVGATQGDRCRWIVKADVIAQARGTADRIALDDRARTPVDLDADARIAGNDVARAGRRPADRVAGRAAPDKDANGIGNRGFAGDVGADQVAFDDSGTGCFQLNPGSGVARDDVLIERGGTANLDACLR